MYNQRTPKDFNIQKLGGLRYGFTILRSNLYGRNLSIKVSQTNKMRSTLWLKPSTRKLIVVKVCCHCWKRLHAARPTHPVGSFQTGDDPWCVLMMHDHLYKKNIFSVVRQMKYSTQGFDKDNELDLCISVKRSAYHCRLKGQSYRSRLVNAMHQYQTNRHPQNRMATPCLDSLRHG